MTEQLELVSLTLSEAGARAILEAMGWRIFRVVPLPGEWDGPILPDLGFVGARETDNRALSAKSKRELLYKAAAVRGFAYPLVTAEETKPPPEEEAELWAA